MFSVNSNGKLKHKTPTLCLRCILLLYLSIQFRQICYPSLTVHSPIFSFHATKVYIILYCIQLITKFPQAILLMSLWSVLYMKS